MIEIGEVMKAESLEPLECGTVLWSRSWQAVRGGLPCCERDMATGLVKLTRHARVRAQQRAVRRGALAAVLDYGTSRPAGNGSHEFFLGHREVVAARRTGVDLRRFEGTAVIATAYLKIITVYKTSRPAARREV